MSQAPSPQAGRSLQEGAEGGQGLAEARATLGWAAAGGFGAGAGPVLRAESAVSATRVGAPTGRQLGHRAAARVK